MSRSRQSSIAPRASHVSGLGPAPPYAAGPGHVSASYLGPPPPAPGMSSTALSRPQSRIEPPPLSMTTGPMPGTLERPINGPKKRLIMTCDGTWLNFNNSIKNGQKQPPSNVSRIGWAIKDTSRDGIPQIVSYQAGVGTEGGTLDRIVGGATGSGLKENVREAYTYLAQNWRPGDEIFLIGFSRGAYTARSVGGFIGELGLLTSTGLPHFNEIWEDFSHKKDRSYVSPFPDSPFKGKGPFGKRYVATLNRMGMTRLPIDIKAICCFDTVGSLGVPQTSVFSSGGRQAKQMQFWDTSLSPCIENAFQALALDEHRAAFSPALWEKGRDNDRTNLKQVWFPGVHSNIGGGYDDQEIANLTLAWMMSRLEPFLDFRSDFLITQHSENVKYYRDAGQKPRWWSFGEIYRSLTGVYFFGGSKFRTPGNYYRVDRVTGRTTDSKLRNTNEYIHASVRTRVGLQGPGIEDKGIYEPRALQDWTYESEAATASGQGGNLADSSLVVWSYRGSGEKGGQTRIPEAVLLETELALLRQCPQAEQFVKTGARQKSSRRRSNMPNGGGRESMMAGGVGGGGGGNRDSRRRSMRHDSRPPPDDNYDSEEERERRRRRRRSGDPRDPERRRRRRDDDG